MLGARGIMLEATRAWCARRLSGEEIELELVAAGTLQHASLEQRGERDRDVAGVCVRHFSKSLVRNMPLELDGHEGKLLDLREMAEIVAQSALELRDVLGRAPSTPPGTTIVARRASRSMRPILSRPHGHMTPSSAEI